jgi:hypothetical protein
MQTPEQNQGPLISDIHSRMTCDLASLIAELTGTKRALGEAEKRIAELEAQLSATEPKKE